MAHLGPVVSTLLLLVVGCLCFGTINTVGVEARATTAELPQAGLNPTAIHGGVAGAASPPFSSSTPSSGAPPAPPTTTPSSPPVGKTSGMAVTVPSSSNKAQPHGLLPPSAMRVHFPSSAAKDHNNTSGGQKKKKPKFPNEAFLNATFPVIHNNASLQNNTGNTSIYDQVWPGIGHTAGSLLYYGGPILASRPWWQGASTLTLYPFFYGTWSQSDKNSIFNFMFSLGDASADAQGSTVHKWWKIVAKNTRSDGTGVAQKVNVGVNVYTVGSYSTHFNDGSSGTSDDFQWWVWYLTTQLKYWPVDPNGIYIIFTSSDITVGPASGGFCRKYCGWHKYTTINGQILPYAFIGDPTTQCNGACGGNRGYPSSPNGAYHGDNVISCLAHEIAEAATDPTFWSWLAWDPVLKVYQENGDLCAWTFGTQYTSSHCWWDSYWPYYHCQTDYIWNLRGINGWRWNVQQNVDPWIQQCVSQTCCGA